MRRLFVIVATILLVMVGVWLASKPIARIALGPGEELVARTGVDRLLVGDGKGRWFAFSSAARGAGDGIALGALKGRPVIDAAGGVWARSGADVSHWTPAATTIHALDLPEQARLLGAPGDGALLLVNPLEGLVVEELVLGDEADAPAQRRPVTADGRNATVVDPSLVVCSPWSEAFANPTPAGWEAWTRSHETGRWRVVMAKEHTKPGAVFTPDGEHLILQGRIDGLWLLDLEQGRLEFMGDGNLGRSRRVANDMAFVRGEAPVLFVGQWTLDRRLHVTSSHLGGGGRYQPKVGLFHDYAPVLSWDGSLLVYLQGEFDEQGDEPFDEAIYCMDRTKPEKPAVFVDGRPGGRSAQGPVFFGRTASFVYIADGEVRGVAVDRPLQTPP